MQRASVQTVIEFRFASLHYCKRGSAVITLRIKLEFTNTITAALSPWVRASSSSVLRRVRSRARRRLLIDQHPAVLHQEPHLGVGKQDALLADLLGNGGLPLAGDPQVEYFNEKL